MNRSRILRSAAVLLFAFTLVSCSIDNRDSDQSNGITNPGPDQVEWTVMYYGAGNYDGDLINEESRTLLTLRALENTVPSPSVRMVALVGSAESDGQCLMYEIHSGNAITDNGIQSTVISDWGVRDMSSSDVIAQFADTVAARYPAKKYMLIVSGDGRGWMGACRDENAGASEFMPITAMQQVLSNVNGLDGRSLKIDLLYWMVPNMGMLEVGYEMKDLVHNMISSATTATVEHYRMMQSWLQDLNGAPEIDGLQLGRLIMRSSEEAGTFYRLPVEMSLLDLSQIAGVARNMDALSNLLSNEFANHSVALASLREAAWSSALDDTSMVDIEALLNALSDDPELMAIEGIETATTDVRTALDAARIERLDTRELDGRFGVTIHFPPFAQHLYLPEYGELQISQFFPNWTRFITAVSPEYVEPITMSGLVRNLYVQRLINVGVFLMTGSSFDDIIAEKKAEISYVNSIGDSANFLVVMPIAQAPVDVRFGVFTDPDSNGFDQGDVFGLGNWTPGQQWQTITPGTLYDSLFCRLNNTRN